MDGATFLFHRELKRQACEQQQPQQQQQPQPQRDALKLSINDETTLATLHERYKEDIPSPLRKAQCSTESLLALYDVALKSERQRSLFSEHHALDLQKQIDAKDKILGERERHVVALDARIAAQEIHIAENAALRRRCEQLDAELFQVVKKNGVLSERIAKQAGAMTSEFTERNKRARETLLEKVNVIEERMKVAMVDLADEKKVTVMELFDELRLNVALN